MNAATLKSLSKKYGKDLVIVFDKFAQPDFSKYKLASVIIPVEKLTGDYAKLVHGRNWRR